MHMAQRGGKVPSTSRAVSAEYYCHIVILNLLGGCKHKIYNMTTAILFICIYTHSVNSKFGGFFGTCKFYMYVELKCFLVVKAGLS